MCEGGVEISYREFEVSRAKLVKRIRQMTKVAAVTETEESEDGKTVTMRFYGDAGKERLMSEWVFEKEFFNQYFSKTKKDKK